jgi:hypothetical protein
MYEHYCPEKLSSVPQFLQKYAGQEARLIEALVTKYGPEPPPSGRTVLPAATRVEGQR